MAQTPSKRTINDSVSVSARTGRLIIKDLETGDMYKKLYNLQNERIDGLLKITSLQDTVIKNQTKQLEFSTKIIGGYETINTQLVDVIKLNNTQGNKQNTVIFVVLGTLVAILVLKR